MSLEDDRLDRLQDTAFERAVVQATAQVSENLAVLHRRRLVAQTAGTVAMIMAVIAIIVMVATHSANQNTNRANATYNCHLLTEIAQILGSGNGALKLQGKPEGLISSEALLRRARSFDDRRIRTLRAGSLKALLSDPETTRLNKLTQEAEARTTQYWSTVLIPELHHLARINCAAALK